MTLLGNTITTLEILIVVIPKTMASAEKKCTIGSGKQETGSMTTGNSFVTARIIKMPRVVWALYEFKH